MTGDENEDVLKLKLDVEIHHYDIPRPEEIRKLKL
jgi:hypothetical protein